MAKVVEIFHRGRQWCIIPRSQKVYVLLEMLIQRFLFLNYLGMDK